MKDFRSIDFVIIGAQKSASTFLQYAIQDHPLTYMPKGELAHFEDPDFEQSGNTERFNEKFRGAGEDVLVGFKRPNYLCLPEVPGRLAATFPDARLVAVLRNPIDRFISAAFHYMRDCFIPVMPLDVLVETLLRAEPTSQFTRQYPRSAELLAFGYYGSAIRRYQKCYATDHLLLLRHEDVAARPVDAISNVFAFLGLPSHESAVLNERPQRIPYNRLRLRVGRVESRLMHKLSSDRTRLEQRKSAPVRRGLAGGIRMIDSALERVVSNPRPRLAPDHREMLASHYKEEMSLLQTQTGLDTSNWL